MDNIRGEFPVYQSGFCVDVSFTNATGGAQIYNSSLSLLEFSLENQCREERL
jgi:hypothetical protein